MKDNKNEVTPIIVNGELNTRKKNKKKMCRRDLLPKKSFGFGDIVLSLIGLLLVIYGFYTIINKDNKANIRKDDTVDSNIVSNTNREKLNSDSIKNNLQFSKEELSNVYSPSDLQEMIKGLNVINLSNNAKLALALKFSNPHVIGNEIYILDEELDRSMKALFGNDIIYQKDTFTLGNNIYTYNQETKRYYLLDNTKTINLMYQKHSYNEVEEIGDKLVVREYIAYTDLNGIKSWTLNNIMIQVVINENNIKEQYKNLKYFEYVFQKNGDNYQLVTITIK